MGEVKADSPIPNIVTMMIVGSRSGHSGRKNGFETPHPEGDGPTGTIIKNWQNPRLRPGPRIEYGVDNSESKIVIPGK